MRFADLTHLPNDIQLKLKSFSKKFYVSNVSRLKRIFDRQVKRNGFVFFWSDEKYCESKIDFNAREIMDAV